MAVLSATKLKKLTTQKNKLVRSKKPKINIYRELDNYLYNNRPLQSEVLQSKTQLRTAITYLFESLMKLPLISIYLDKHLNGKVEGLLSHDPLEILEFYKKLIFENGIKQHHLYKFFPNRTYQTSINTLVSKKGYTIAEAKDYYINRKVINPLELNSLFDSKTTKKAEDIEIINNAIKRGLEFEKNKSAEVIQTISEPISKSDIVHDDGDIFIKVLTNDIFKSLHLTLFDISVLKNTNEFLYTFIDIHNNKRYYKEPFYIEFFINTSTGVLNNDFIEDITSKFQKYVITDIKELSQLRFLLGRIRTQFMKDL